MKLSQTIAYEASKQIGHTRNNVIYYITMCIVYLEKTDLILLLPQPTPPKPHHHHQYYYYNCYWYCYYYYTYHSCCCCYYSFCYYIILSIVCKSKIMLRLLKMSSKIARTLILITINHLYQHMHITELKTLYKFVTLYMFWQLNCHYQGFTKLWTTHSILQRRADEGNLALHNRLLLFFHN